MRMREYDNTGWPPDLAVEVRHARKHDTRLHSELNIGGSHKSVSLRLALPRQ